MKILMSFLLVSGLFVSQSIAQVAAVSVESGTTAAAGASPAGVFTYVQNGESTQGLYVGASGAFGLVQKNGSQVKQLGYLPTVGGGYYEVNGSGEFTLALYSETQQRLLIEQGSNEGTAIAIVGW